MAYDHTKIESTLVRAQDLTSTGDKGYYNCAIRPQRLRRAAVMITTATVGTTGIVKIEKRVTAGSDTGRVTVATINVPALAAGKVVYIDNLNVDVLPGQELVAKVDTAIGTSGNGTVTVELETRPDVPANFSNLQATT